MVASTMAKELRAKLGPEGTAEKTQRLQVNLFVWMRLLFRLDN